MGAKESNLALRLMTAAVMVPIILTLVFVTPPWSFYLLALPASLLGVHELLTMSHPADAPARFIGVAVSAVASLAVFFCHDDPRVLVALLTLVPLVGPMVTLVRIGAIETAAVRAFALGVAPLLVAVPLALLALMRVSVGGKAGSGAVFLALGLGWFTDTTAYFAGRFLGRHKLYEAVSPKKTVEGAIGGLAGSVFWAVLGTYTFARDFLPLAHAVPLALLAGSLGIAGDLAESLLKRSTGIKDSGSLVPGHGGMLDRIDALLVTSVVVYLYAQWVYRPAMG
jgi:phosphatidate cytidylyltransferase